jgi:hypothetical protein
LLYIYDLLGRGRKPHIQPGSLKSVAIREAVRSGGGHKASLVANNTKDRPVLKELNPDIPRLKPAQVHNVLHDKRHCESDIINTKLVKRLKPIHKPGGYEATTRLEYTKELAEYVQNEVILVVVDKKKYSLVVRQIDVFPHLKVQRHTGHQFGLVLFASNGPLQPLKTSQY